MDPSIFGTLLEQALDPNERGRSARISRRALTSNGSWSPPSWSRCAKNGATCRPRPKPSAPAGDRKGAAAEVRAFHDRLCATRVLDPACGTGNFLYVSLELMKRLEGEVLEALLDLGGQEALAAGLGAHSVDPHQFLGLEKNPRAAADCRTGAVDRLSAMAFPHQGRAAGRADPARVQEHLRSRMRC